MKRGVPQIPSEEASAVAVTEADARLQYHRSFRSTVFSTVEQLRFRLGSPTAAQAVNQIQARESQVGKVKGEEKFPVSLD